MKMKIRKNKAKAMGVKYGRRISKNGEKDGRAKKKDSAHPDFFAYAIAKKTRLQKGDFPSI